MNTAANAPKSPAKNNATLSFMVQDRPAAQLLDAHTRSDFPLQLQRVHVTNRNSHSSCTLVHPLSSAGLCWATGSRLFSCLCYGRTELSTWLLWTLPGSAASPPPQAIFGVWLKAAAPLHCGAECVKGGDQRRNNRWQLDTHRLHGNVRAGWDRKDRREVQYSTTPCPNPLPHQGNM